jgi:histidine triad (HIT) family protein
MDCIFCKIIKKEISAEVLQESDNVVIIRDIRPSAPIHYLVLPKRHISSIKDTKIEDEALLGNLIQEARIGAEKLGLSGYKLVFNVGKDGGQIIDHIHLHLLGGWKSGESNEVNGVAV